MSEETIRSSGDDLPRRVAAAVVDRPGASPYLSTVDLPDAPPGRTLLRVLAAPLNPLDLHIASGEFHSARHETPYVPGSECVGVVQQSSRYPVGTRVYAQCAAMPTRPGTFATHVVVDDADVLPVPECIDSVTAAAVGNSGVAAYLPLIDTARLGAGDSVLILGATGVVGQLAVQIAKAHGADCIVGVGRDAAALERVRQLGADVVVALVSGESSDDLAERILQSGNRRPDVVLDGLCGVPLEAAMLACADHARVVNVGNSAGPAAQLLAGGLRARQLQITGFAGLHVPMSAKQPALEWLWQQVCARRLQLPVRRTSLVDIEQAWSDQKDSPHTKNVVFFA